MPVTQTTPTIRNAATQPGTPRKLFVNIPVMDLQRSIDFFETLGFVFNPQFTDATATCMLDIIYLLHGKASCARFLSSWLASGFVGLVVIVW